MSYMNRRGRIGHSISQKYKSLPLRRRMKPYKPSINRIRLAAIGGTSLEGIPLEGHMSLGQLGRNTFKSFASNAYEGWRNTSGDWKKRLRKALLGGLRAGTITAGKDGYEYARERWSDRQWWPDNWRVDDDDIVDKWREAKINEDLVEDDFAIVDYIDE